MIEIVIAVGDGFEPRTAATFACLTKWDTISVDPNLRDHKDYSKIQRLVVRKARIEDCAFQFDHPVIIAMVHAHVRPDVTLKSIKAPSIHMVSIPCCVQGGWPRIPDLSYIDWHIWSPKNRVDVWDMQRRS